MTIDYSIVFQQFLFFYQKCTFVSLNKLDFMNHYILLKLLNMIFFFALISTLLNHKRINNYSL